MKYFSSNYIWRTFKYVIVVPVFFLLIVEIIMLIFVEIRFKNRKIDMKTNVADEPLTLDKFLNDTNSSKLRKVNQFVHKISLENFTIPDHFKIPPVTNSIFNSKNKQKHKQPQKILLLAEYRTGSTFTSEIFNQASSIFYSYEPLTILKSKSMHLHCDAEKHINNLKIDILDDFFNKCQLPLTENFLEESDISMIGSRNVRQQLQDCFNYSICNRNKHQKYSCNVQDFEDQKKRFETETGMRVDEAHRVFRNFRKNVNNERKRKRKRKRRSIEHRINSKVHCPNLTETEIYDDCSSSSARVAKTIRICTIEEIVKRSSTFKDLKILYLVRDPRGIANSRMNSMGRTENEVISNLCDRFYENLFFLSKLSDQRDKNLNNRIKIIRYEDLATLSFNEAKRILNYYQLYDKQTEQEIISWLNLNTRWKTHDNSYSTRKDPLESAFSWKEKLSVSQIRRIQDPSLNKNCSVVMKMLGYRKLKLPELDFEPVVDFSKQDTLEVEWRLPERDLNIQSSFDFI